MKPTALKRHAPLCALSLASIALSGCTAQAQNAQGTDAQAAPQAATSQAAASSVALLKTPNEGIQPQAAMDSKGMLHLIYFRGEPKAGDIFYVRSPDGGKSFSAPLRVNSQPNSAIATGTIRGAQLALGKNNRVHVAWNGSGMAEPKGVGGAPMLYARLNDAQTAFEPQRNLITWAGGLDGGGTLAADAQGRVFVAWHAAAGARDDARRAVFLARSTNDGASFGREKKVSMAPTGACGCCQMRAMIDGSGALYIVYRTAQNNINRDSTLLASRDGGATFSSTMLQPWSILECPMSSYALAPTPRGILAAWETENQVFLEPLASPGAASPDAASKTASKTASNAAVKPLSKPLAAPGEARERKHPVVLANANGQVLLAWTEGTGWNRGGGLAWQMYGANGQPTADKGRAQGVPVWGLLSGVVLPDGGFLLLH